MTNQIPEDDPPYIVKRTVYRLVWPEGDPRHGLVVRVMSLPTGTLLQLAPHVKALQALRAEDLTLDEVPVVLEPFRIVSEYLVSWNVQEDIDGRRRPVPATFEGLLSQEIGLIVAVLRAWLQASGSIPDPLGPPSSGGVSGEELALSGLPMTSLPELSGTPG